MTRPPQTLSSRHQSPEFAAWVPTITGHLSFSFVGHGVDSCLAANSETTPQGGTPLRRVLVLQHRTMRDLPYTRWPMAIIRPWIAADYLLIGSSRPEQRPAFDPKGKVIETRDEMGALVGELVVVPHHDDKSLRKEAKDLVKALRLAIAAFSDEAPRGVPVDIDTLDQDVRRLLAAAQGKQVQLIRAEFALHRTGELRLRMTKTPPIKGAPAGSTAALMREKILARQIYYFAKDIAHRHYHHEASADNLLPLIEAPPNDDQTWRRETLWSLARAVLEVRRRDHLSDYKGAIGILAYAEAFQALMGRVMRNPAGKFVPATQIVPYDFCHTRSSLEAKIDERAWIASGWSQFWTVLVTTLIAAAALWIGGIQVKDAACASMLPPAPVVSADASFEVSAKFQGARPPPTGKNGAAGQPSQMDLRVVRSEPSAPQACSLPSKPPQWASRLLLYVVSDPGGLIGLLTLVGFLYFEFARRSFRSVRASRFLVSSPWEWLSALGGTVSRHVRRINPLWGDPAGRLSALVGAVGVLGLMTWAFVVLL